MPDSGFESSLDEAARLLVASRFPVIGGLATDVAGVVAALRLAERLGGAIDHGASEPGLREVSVMRDFGLMGVTAGEARRRADMVLVIGDGALDALGNLLAADDGSEARPRRVLALSSRPPGLGSVPGEAVWLKCSFGTIGGRVGALRAAVNGHPTVALDMTELSKHAETLKSAAYGVVLWCAEEIDALVIEMLAGLVRDLNATTRWSGLSVGRDISAAGAAMASAWLTGYPLRTGFGRGLPEHDPWRFDARRLVESGEADAVLWISAFGAPPPAWLTGTPTVLVATAPAITAGRVAVRIEVGAPGRDHDAVLFEPRTGTLVERRASAPSPTPSVADALARIAERLPG